MNDIPLASNIKPMGMNNMATAVMHGETAITNTIGDGAHRRYNKKCPRYGNYEY